MTTHHCDICEVKIEKPTDSVYLSDSGMLQGKTLCLACGKPVLEFMKQHSLREVVIETE